MKKLFDFDDLLITPTTISPISSRSEINVRNSDGYLPLLTAPMDTVITEKNFKLFESNGIIPVLPRIPNTTSDWVDTSLFLSYGLDDFNNIFIELSFIRKSFLNLDLILIRTNYFCQTTYT